MSALCIRSPIRSLVASAIVLAAIETSTTVHAQAPQTVRVRGTVESLADNTLVVRAREGQSIPIRLADNWSISGIVNASLAEIKPGTFIGTAAMPQRDGGLRALEVLVFPEAMRGAGEGHYAWDLMPESTMTNATVSEAVQAVEGHTLTLTYKGEQKKVVVPPNVPIVTFAPAQKTDVVVGAPVFISTQRQPDGSLTASRVTVGLNGVAPPM